MIKLTLLVLSFVTLLAAQSQPDPNYCYALDSLRTQKPRWSDRTSYENIRGSTINSKVSSCTPARFWLYMRHGDRLPSTNDINRMIPFSSTVSKKKISNYFQKSYLLTSSTATQQHRQCLLARQKQPLLSGL